MTSPPALLLALLLSSEFFGASVPVSVAGRYDDIRADTEGLNALAEDVDDVADVGRQLTAGAGPGGVLDLRRLALERGPDGRHPPRIIIVSDTGFRGHRTHSLDTAYSRSPPALSDPAEGGAPGELSVKIDRREADLELLRCMIGRVYRPCWQA